jgi:alpha-N-acetylglucosamine transferase
VVYATYLSAPAEEKESQISYFKNSSDPYFDGARILTYQILHAPETRTKLNIPFVVFVHENVDRVKRDRLALDGAQVIEWSDFRVDWIRPRDYRWVDVLTKLRLWEMEQYDLIVFLDGDSVLTRCIDYFLIDPSTWPKKPHSPTFTHNGVVIPLPQTYIAAGLPQLRQNHSSHPSRVPEDFWDWNTLNSGFMILQPSLKMFRYFEALLAVENSFDSSIGDQSVLNVALSRSGPTPWTTVDLSWNIQWPWPDDIKAGYPVLHEKWWAPTHRDCRDYFMSWYWRMVGYYESAGYTQHT